MMEIKELLKISLVSSLLNLETIQFGQFLISRPSFSAFILGLIIGHPLECFFAGILIEAIYLDFTPIGGVVPPNGVFACAIFAYLFKSSNSFSISFFMAIISGFLYAEVDRRLRWKRSEWNERYLKDIDSGNFNPGIWVRKSLILDLISVFVFSIAFGLVLIQPSIFFLKNYFLKQWADTAFLAIPFVAGSSLYFRLSGQARKND